jgi:hypothetical protein
VSLVACWRLVGWVAFVFCGLPVAFVWIQESFRLDLWKKNSKKKITQKSVDKKIQPKKKQNKEFGEENNPFWKVILGEKCKKKS